MKQFFVAIVLIVCLSATCWGAPLLTADDFIPVIQAPEEQREELSTVQSPDAVATEEDPALQKPVTKGMSVQDAINAIVARHDQGCDMIATPDGGYGFVATGIGSYRKDMKSITALRIAQRNAYVQALMRAKGEMANLVGGMVIEGFTNFDEQISARDNDTDEEQGLRNRIAENSESYKNAVSGVLKGYVTYSVIDDFEHGEVYVTIVSTPKTRGKFSRLTNDSVNASTINEGLNAILAEIQSGLVPLVGGRIITVPATGEIAFVGFGSAVVRQDKNPAMRSSLLRTARSSAGLRAADALCGIIVGDSINMTTKLDETTTEAMKDFEEIETTDPMTELVTKEEVALAEGRQIEFRNRMEFSQTIASARKGTLPPGVIRRAWLDDEGAFAYALAVYIPSVSNAAAAGAKEMQDAKILQDVDPEAGKLKQEQQENESVNMPSYKDSGVFKQNKTGTVIQDI